MNVVSPGDRITGYAVEEVLGRGGWAVVYRARDTTDRAVALKVLNEQHRRPAQLARLHREFEFARRLDNPNIVTVYDAGPNWLAMELVDGPPLNRLPELTDRLTVLTQIAAALDYAHRCGIVHGDVKPSNILVAQDISQLRGVLIDFGVAHAVAEDVGRRPSHIEASLPYSAPELLSGHAPSAATDEYALACTTVEILTGSPPFTAHTAMGLMDEHLHRPPPRISRRISWVPHAVDSILAKAMAKSPDSRYNSCSEFMRLIVRALR